MQETKGYNTYEELINLIDQSGENYNLDTINKAYALALKAHKGQKRISGDDYIAHPVSVAYILVELGMDTSTVCAGLLHDVVEDTDVTKEYLEKEFGEEIAELVDGVTKLATISSSAQDEEKQAENIRKILLATDKDIRVIMIKLADRLNNMRTLDCRSLQKKRDISLQTMEIYAPIAHRLGIRTIKDELEDISLKYLDPVAYEEVEGLLALKKTDREKFINLIKKRLMDRIQKFIPDVYIEGRVKSANEIYKKIFIKGRAMDQIYDIYAVRVIVNTITDCYNVFGIVHDMFQPIPSRFKDYISTPKPNMYQSLHTTVLSKEGIPFEIQIRTWEMHRTAEYGIAAHWKYKLGVSSDKDSWMKPLSWVRKLLDNHKDAEDVTDVLGTIKSDLGPKEIFVLTPKGDVINLPSGATVIDFAYAIHSELGNRMVAAKVNKKIVPLNYVLKMWEIVDIIRTNDPKKGPSRDWLEIVKTSEARSKIRQWFKREKREENIIRGKNATELELSKHKIVISDDQLEEFLSPILKKNQCGTLDDFFASVGYGGIQLWKIIPRLENEYAKKKKNEKESINEIVEVKNESFVNGKKITGIKESSVIVKDVGECVVKFSKCCNPLPGDNIIGFITKGHGISVHTCNCKNVVNSLKNKDFLGRWISVKWSKETNSLFEIVIKIEAGYRQNLLSEVVNKINEMNLKFSALSSKFLPNDNVGIEINVFIKSLEHLEFIKNSLLKIKDVISVERA